MARNAQAISELFPVDDAFEPVAGAVVMKLDTIRPAAHQPRDFIHDKPLHELAASIREHGVLQPITVRYVTDGFDPKVRYEIVAGERRYEAAKLAGLFEVPVILKDLSDDARFEIGLIENVLREDLSAYEECKGVAELQKRRKYSVTQLVEKLGKDRGWVNNRLAGAKAADDVQELLKQYHDVLSHALEIDRVKSPFLRRKLINMTKDGKSVAEIRSQIATHEPRKTIPIVPGEAFAPEPSTPIVPVRGQVPTTNYELQRSFELPTASHFPPRGVARLDIMTAATTIDRALEFFHKLAVDLPHIDTTLATERRIELRQKLLDVARLCGELGKEF